MVRTDHPSFTAEAEAYRLEVTGKAASEQLAREGTVVSRNVNQGQTVAASFQTPTLFLIATDLTQMQVDANVSESDIGSVRVGSNGSAILNVSGVGNIDASAITQFNGRPAV